MTQCVPVQVVPLLDSLKPFLQEQVKEPAVLVQTWSQLWVPLKHSLISEGTVLFSNVYVHCYLNAL